jgi:hypothetical protein
MSDERTKLKRGRILLAAFAVLGGIVFCAFERAADETRFFDFLESHPMLRMVVRPLFAVVGQGGEFYREIGRAGLSRRGVDRNLLEYVETLP